MFCDTLLMHIITSGFEVVLFMPAYVYNRIIHVKLFFFSLTWYHIMQFKVMYWNIQYYLLWSMQNFTNALLYNLLHSTMLYNFNLSNDRSHVIFLPLLIPLLFLFTSPVAYNSSISLEAHTHRMLDGTSHLLWYIIRISMRLPLSHICIDYKTYLAFL
jgi:hypothetical protein